MKSSGSILSNLLNNFFRQIKYDFYILTLIFSIFSLNYIHSESIIDFDFFDVSVADSDQIVAQIEVDLNQSRYLIYWYIKVKSPWYYYPADSWFSLPLPQNVDLNSIEVRDRYGEVNYEIASNRIFLYNSRDIYYGDSYYFLISFIRKNAPVSYNNEFYFESGYYFEVAVDSMTLVLPKNVKNYKIIDEKDFEITIISEDPYTIIVESEKAKMLRLIFWMDKSLKDVEIQKDYRNFFAFFPKKYEDSLHPVLFKIDNNWKLIESFFEFKLQKKLNITIIPASIGYIEDNFLCRHISLNNNIECVVGLFSLEERSIMQTILHEIVHAFVSNIFGTGFPPWFEEGLAEYISYNISESLGYKFEDHYIYKKNLLEECAKVLSKNFWERWECERFEDGFVCPQEIFTYSSCFNKYSVDEIRYSVSWYIISHEIIEKIRKEGIQKLSRFFQIHKIKINSSSIQKNDIVVAVLYLTNYIDFSNILESKYKINIRDSWKKACEEYLKAEYEIITLSKNSDYDYFHKAKKILREALSILINGNMNKSIEKSLESVKEANRIKEEAEKTKQKIKELNRTIVELKNKYIDCLYIRPEKLLEKAYEKYRNGDFEISKEHLEHLKQEILRINQEIEIFVKTYFLLSQNINKTFFLFTPFISNFDTKLKESVRYLLDCQLEMANQTLENLKNSYIIHISLAIILYFFIFGSIVFIILKKILKIK